MQPDQTPVSSSRTFDTQDNATQQGASNHDVAGAGETVRLSYKFQRLREKLRAAIASGELSGKLPGERQLARKFRVNAKTLSKALTDLAAEGLLDRNIGRGTFVKGSADLCAQADKWLAICDPEQGESPVVKALIAACPDMHLVAGMPPQRPSFLNAFQAAIILGPQVPDAFIRDLVVRNLTVVLACRQPSTFSTHAVLIDRQLGASNIGRDMMLSGHRRFVAIEERGSTEIADAVRRTAARYAPDATVDAAFVADVRSAVEHGATAIICDSFKTAAEVRAELEAADVAVPGRVSLAAVGTGSAETRISGYFVAPQQIVETVLQTLKDAAVKRPTMLWLTGSPVDHGTIGPTGSMATPGMAGKYHGMSV